MITSGQLRSQGISRVNGLDGHCTVVINTGGPAVEGARTGHVSRIRWPRWCASHINNGGRTGEGIELRSGDGCVINAGITEGEPITIHVVLAVTVLKIIQHIASHGSGGGRRGTGLSPTRRGSANDVRKIPAHHQLRKEADRILEIGPSPARRITAHHGGIHAIDIGLVGRIVREG